MRIRARILVPFNFGLISRVPITFTRFNEKVIFISQRYEGVKVYSYVTDNYKDLQKPMHGKLFLKECQKFTDSNEEFYRLIVCNNESENFLEGTIDLLISTAFDIYFEFPDKEFTQDEKSNEKIRLKAIELLFYFINTYKMFSNEVDVLNPSILEFPIVDLHFSRKKLITDEEIIDGDYEFLARIISSLNNELTGHFKENLSDLQIQNITNFLNSSQPIPLHFKLLLDAKEFSRIHKESNGSIILAATATEVYLQTRLIKECEKRGIQKLPSRKRKTSFIKRVLSFKTSNRITYIGYLDAIITGNIRDDLLGEIATYLTGVNIKASKQYMDWYNLAYKVRNDIIHRGKFERSEDDAKKAFEAVVNLINYIESLMR